MTRISITGNIVNDPEQTQTQTGKTVTKFRLAVNEGKDKPSSFYNITVWDEQGDNVTKSLRKGMRAMVDGRVVLREYEDKNGNKRISPDVTADEVGVALRWATAQVERTGNNSNGQPQQSQWATPQQEWAPAPAGGAGAAANIPAGDPWATGNLGGTETPF